MNRINTSFFIFFFCCFVSLAYAQEQTFRVDPANARGATASELFDEVLYLPLETSKAALFNKIDRLELTENYFIILDDIGNSILLFKRNGDFHCRIDELPDVKKGRFPGDMVATFSVDRARKEIIVKAGYDPNWKPSLGYLGKLYFFDFNGNFLRKQYYDYSISDFSSLGNGHLVFFDTGPHPDEFAPNKFYRLIFLKDNTVTYHKEMLYTQSLSGKDRFGTGKRLLSLPSNNALLVFSDYYDYSIYLLDSLGLQQSCRFIFPQYLSLPPDFKENSVYDGKRKEYITDSHPEKIFAVYNAYKQRDVLSFSTMVMKDNFAQGNYFYKPKTGELLSFSKIAPDSSNHYLPFFGLRDILACDSTYFYSAIASSEVFSSYKNNRQRDMVYPAAIKELINGSNLANPVIVMIKLKK